ncbi:MAG TPA: site-2 protease family protein [Anaerolineae bacterium]
MIGLPLYLTVPLFILVLIPLVLVHELGHFVTAKIFGISAPEFGIGFPPRAFRFWKGAGWIEIQSRHIYIPRTFELPANLNIGSHVVYKTEQVEGRETLTALELVDPAVTTSTLASPVQNFDRGTEYTFNWLPLGGFVRLSGEEDPTAPNAFAAKPAWHRLIVLSAGVVMNFILAFAIFVLMGVFLPQAVPSSRTQISTVALYSPAEQAGLRVNDVIVSINGVDVTNNFEELRKQARANGDREIEMVVQRGAAAGWETVRVKITPRSNPPPQQGALGIGLGNSGLRITKVAPGSLASQIGLRADDALVSIGNNLVLVSDDPGVVSTGAQKEAKVASYIRSLSGAAYVLPVTYIRDGIIQPPVNLKIPANLPADQAGLGLGFRLDAGQATSSSLSQMYGAVTAIPRTIGNAIQQGPSDSGFMGPVGIVRVTGEIAGRAGFWGIINLMGVLSLNLAVVNLFPIPGLDGGRLIFILLEVVRGGRKIDPQKEGVVHLIGMAFLLSLMVLFTFFDVSNWLAGKSLFGP